MPRRIIDAHNHPNWQGLDADGIVRNMDAHGIARTWLLSADGPPSLREAEMEPNAPSVPLDTAAPRLAGLVACLKRHPNRFVGGWAPDFRDRHARARLYQAVKMHGIEVYGELKLRTRYDHPDAIAMFRYCAELGLPVLFHLQYTPHILATECEGPEGWPAWYGGGMDVLDSMCRLCPDTQFIGHAQGFWREISGDADEDPELYAEGPVVPGGRLFDVMRAHANLNCDVSANSAVTALSRDLEVSRALVVEFQDRVLFGRDSFGRAQLDLVEQLELDEATLEKVYHRNAERLIAKVSKGP